MNAPLLSNSGKPRLTPETSPLSLVQLPEQKPRIIVSIDNSWHNFAGLTWLAFWHLIRRAGGVMRCVDYGRGPESEDLGPLAFDIVKQGDALILSGGTDVGPELYGSPRPAKKVNRRRDRFEIALIEQALRCHLPILGVCRGCQLLNVAHGGTLRTIRDIPNLDQFHNRFRFHRIHLKEDSFIAHSSHSETLRVRSIHGQAVDSPGENLEIVGRTEDGVVEAIEHTTRPWVVGVQWHPEYAFYRQPEHRLIQNLVYTASVKRMEPSEKQIARRK